MIEDKVIIITGAGSGLGRATALTAADRDATVVVSDLGTSSEGEGADESPVHETVAEIEAQGGTALAHFGDVTEPDDVETLVSTALAEYGRVDAAINYAGFLRDTMSFKMDDVDWESVVEVHLTGHFNLLRELGAHWRDAYKAGDIETQRSLVCISSEVALGNPGQVNYAAAKAGVLGLTRTAARELHQYDVRVNALMPAAATRLVPDAVAEELPVEKMQPERVARLALALASDETADVTGWTFGAGGDTVATVTDPLFDRTATKAGGWDIDDLPDVVDSLIGERAESKTGYNGMIDKLF
jgi:NAD(P)-dependent dehydrogenase (short-subunit alcohol dehydrogenase family)